MGVAHVLSQATSAPAPRAISTIARMSVTRIRGFDGDSIQMRRVEARTARATSSGRVMSTNVLSRPQGAKCSIRRSGVP